ncbi:MAG: hypothetical protein QG599_1475 [Pseudomonadota bacterium]|nr:hypothetical protein [Pseudomonadota bacterium]
MLKTVGTNGQISLSRKYAGQHFALEEEDGVITLTPLREVPESQDWLQTPEMREKLARADAWMNAHPPRETDLDELMQEVEMRLAAKEPA